MPLHRLLRHQHGATTVGDMDIHKQRSAAPHFPARPGPTYTAAGTTGSFGPAQTSLRTVELSILGTIGSPTLAVTAQCVPSSLTTVGGCGAPINVPTPSGVIESDFDGPGATFPFSQSAVSPTTCQYRIQCGADEYVAFTDGEGYLGDVSWPYSFLSTSVRIDD